MVSLMKRNRQRMKAYIKPQYLTEPLNVVEYFRWVDEQWALVQLNGIGDEGGEGA